MRKKCTAKSHCSMDMLGAREKLKPATRGVWDWKWEMHSSCQRNKGGLWEASHGQAALERQQAQGEEKQGGCSGLLGGRSCGTAGRGSWRLGDGAEGGDGSRQDRK